MLYKMEQMTLGYYFIRCTLKAHSHYCIFHLFLRETVVFPQRDRHFSISALTQSTAENADCCGKCESAFRVLLYVHNWLQVILTYGEVALLCLPPVYFIWIRLLCLCWFNNSLLVWIQLLCLCWLNNSKPVKQEVSRTVIVPPMVSVNWLHILATSFGEGRIIFINNLHCVI